MAGDALVHAFGLRLVIVSACTAHCLSSLIYTAGEWLWRRQELCTSAKRDAGESLGQLLERINLSNCLPHLEKNNIKDVAGFLKAPASDLKAIGFRGEVRAKLQRAMKGESTPEDQSGEQEKFVTVDEEEENALESQANKGAGKKKKRSGKSSSKPTGSFGFGGSMPVPGEDGHSMDPALANLLTALGLASHIPIFQNNNITSVSDCVRLTREALVGNFAVPDDKAGLLLSHIKNAVPGASAGRPLPELARDLAAVISVMKIPEQLRDQVRTSLQTNNVLSVQDAKDRRFALMNEVGLTAEAATELGRCLDAGPAILPPAQPHPVEEFTGMAPGMGMGMGMGFGGAQQRGTMPMMNAPQQGQWQQSQYGFSMPTLYGAMNGGVSVQGSGPGGVHGLPIR